MSKGVLLFVVVVLAVLLLGAALARPWDRQGSPGTGGGASGYYRMDGPSPYGFKAA